MKKEIITTEAKKKEIIEGIIQIYRKLPEDAKRQFENEVKRRAENH